MRTIYQTVAEYNEDSFGRCWEIVAGTWEDGDIWCANCLGHLSTEHDGFIPVFQREQIWAVTDSPYSVSVIGLDCDKCETEIEGR